MKEFCKHLWYDYVLRVITVILIVFGVQLMGGWTITVGWVVGLLISVIGWVIQFTWYPHKNDDWEYTNKD